MTEKAATQGSGLFYCPIFREPAAAGNEWRELGTDLIGSLPALANQSNKQSDKLLQGGDALLNLKHAVAKSVPSEKNGGPGQRAPAREGSNAGTHQWILALSW